MKRAVRFICLCLVIGTGTIIAQYVEDSIELGNVEGISLTYNSHSDIIYIGSDKLFFTLSCSTNRVVPRFPMVGGRIVYASSVNKAYLPVNPYDWCDSVVVVDGRIHNRIKSIPILCTSEAGVLDDILYDSIGNRVYVAVNYWDYECDQIFDTIIAVIDCLTDSVVEYINSGDERRVLGLKLNSRHRKLYILSSLYGEPDGDAISIVDLRTNQIIKTIVLGGENLYTGCYFEDVDKFYYGGFDGLLGVIDGESDSLLRTISMPPDCFVLGFLPIPGHNLLLIFGRNSQSGMVYVVDALNDSLLYGLQINGYPAKGIRSGNTGLIYCLCITSITVIDSTCSRIVTQIPFPDGIGDGVISPVSGRVYIGVGSKIYVIRDVVGVKENADSYTPKRWNLVTIAKNGVLWRRETAFLVDITGSKRWELKEGENNLTFLPAGVYLAIDKNRTLRAKVVKVK